MRSDQPNWFITFCFVSSVVLRRRFLMAHREFNLRSGSWVLRNWTNRSTRPSAMKTYEINWFNEAKMDNNYQIFTGWSGENSMIILHTADNAALVTFRSSSSFLKILKTVIPSPLSTIFVRTTCTDRPRTLTHWHAANRTPTCRWDRDARIVGISRRLSVTSRLGSWSKRQRAAMARNAA